MMSTSSSVYHRTCSIEDDWVAVKSSPFSERDSYTLPAVAVDWNSSQAAFHVTLLTLSNDKTDEKLWSDSFSISKIGRRHFELCLVYPELKSHLPTLPQESQGMWGYFQWVKVSPTLCKKLEEYIKEAFNICGWRLFSSVFFGEPTFFEEDYTISSLELKRSKYVQEVDQLLENFQKHLEERSQVETAQKLIEWYEKLDNLLSKVNDAERKLLEFDCEPFEELRDIAQKERYECAAVFNLSLTASSFQDSSQSFMQWEEQYVDSVKKINEFRLEYFKMSLSRLQHVKNSMEDDLLKFSESYEERESVTARLGEIEKEIVNIEIKVLNCIHQAKVLERDKLRQDAVTLDEDIGLEEALTQKETEFYRKQDEILGIELEIQDKNENIIRLDLKRLKNCTNAENDCEKKTKEKMAQSLSNISRKKAKLRNKRNKCKEAVKKIAHKEEQKQVEHVKHHAVQMKIERRREEEDEKKDTRLEERQKTLLRLKEYKKKHGKPKVVKPPRYQPPSCRKKEQKVKTDPTSTPSLTNPSVSHTSKKGNVEKTTAEQLPEKVPCSPSPPAPPATPATPATHATPNTTVTPSVNLTPPPPPPPPPPPLPISDVRGSGSGLAGTGREQKQDSSDVRSPSALTQPSSLSQETVNLDAILLARDRLKKKHDTSAGGTKNNQKSFPSGIDLTRAIQSVKLRRVVNEEKPSDLSPNGAEFLKRALERMNRFTTLSNDDEEDKEDELEQEW